MNSGPPAVYSWLFLIFGTFYCLLPIIRFSILWSNRKKIANPKLHISKLQRHFKGKSQFTSKDIELFFRDLEPDVVSPQKVREKRSNELNSISLDHF
jgi:hypothetical protein